MFVNNLRTECVSVWRKWKWKRKTLSRINSGHFAYFSVLWYSFHSFIDEWRRRYTNYRQTSKTRPFFFHLICYLINYHIQNDKITIWHSVFIYFVIKCTKCSICWYCVWHQWTEEITSKKKSDEIIRVRLFIEFYYTVHTVSLSPVNFDTISRLPTDDIFLSLDIPCT